MTIKENLGRVASTLVAMIHTRIELVSIELEQELMRFSRYFVMSLVALFCAGMAVILLTLLVIVMFWESYRIPAILSLVGLYAVATIVLVTTLKGQFANRPRLFEHTIAELKKDVQMVHRSPATSASNSDANSATNPAPNSTSSPASSPISHPVSHPVIKSSSNPTGPLSNPGFAMKRDNTKYSTQEHV